jgi:hypothetical protein
MPRISVDFGYVVVSLVQIFVHGFADLDIGNTVGLERILHFARGYPLELRKIDPHLKNSNHIRNIIVVVSFYTQLVNLQSSEYVSNLRFYFYFTSEVDSTITDE